MDSAFNFLQSLPYFALTPESVGIFIFYILLFSMLLIFKERILAHATGRLWVLLVLIIVTAALLAFGVYKTFDSKVHIAREFDIHPRDSVSALISKVYIENIAQRETTCDYFPMQKLNKEEIFVHRFSCVFAERTNNRIFINLVSQLSQPQINGKSDIVQIEQSNSPRLNIVFSRLFDANKKHPAVIPPRFIDDISFVLLRDGGGAPQPLQYYAMPGKNTLEVCFATPLPVGKHKLVMRFSYVPDNIRNNSAIAPPRYTFQYDLEVAGLTLAATQAGLSYRGVMNSVQYPTQATLSSTRYTNLHALKPRSYVFGEVPQVIPNSGISEVSFVATLNAGAVPQIFFGNYRFDVGGSDGRSITRFHHASTGKPSSSPPVSLPLRNPLKPGKLVFVKLVYTAPGAEPADLSFHLAQFDPNDLPENKDKEEVVTFPFSSFVLRGEKPHVVRIGLYHKENARRGPAGDAAIMRVEQLRVGYIPSPVRE